MIRVLFLFFWFALFISQSMMDLGAILLGLTGLWYLGKFPEVRNRAFRSMKTNCWVWLCLVWLVIIFVGLFVVAPPEAPRWVNFLEFRWMLELGLWVILLKSVRWQDRDLKWFLMPPLLSSIYGIWVWITKIDPIYPEESHDRIGGLIGNPMPFAHTTGPVAAGLAAICLLAFIRRKALPKYFWIGTAVICFAVVMTLTRGIWGGLLLAALVVPPALKMRRALLVSLGLVIFTAVVTAAVPFLRDRVTQAFDPSRSYDSQRVTLWETNLEMAKEHPLFGMGYGENRRRLREYFDRKNLPPGQFESHAHNQYLHFLSGTGSLGLFCYLLFIGCALWITWKMIRHPSGVFFQDSAAIGLLAAQIVFEVGSLTESNFSISKNRYFILLVIAAVIALSHQRANTLKSPRP